MGLAIGLILLLVIVALLLWQHFDPSKAGYLFALVCGVLSILTWLMPAQLASSNQQGVGAAPQIVVSTGPIGPIGPITINAPLPPSDSPKVEQPIQGEVRPSVRPDLMRAKAHLDRENDEARAVGEEALSYVPSGR